MYTVEEDVINSATHFLSAVASILFTFLITFNVDISQIEIVSIFLMGFTGAWTFLSSYMYHSAREFPKRTRNQLLDKSAIYVMIGGNGACTCLIASSSTFSLICSLLLIGTASALTAYLCLSSKVSETFTLTSYLLMGWLSVVPASGLIVPSKFTDLPQLICLLGGGAAYSLGVAFYINEKKWYHSIWHGFTMLGFGLHMAACYFCL